MGWSVGYDGNLKRDIGYGVPALCDHPGCSEEIHRGLAYRCGHINSDNGCGLHFCEKHRTIHEFHDGEWASACQCCSNEKEPFEPKPDLPEWNEWKLTDESWQQWRNENPDEVKRLRNLKSLN